MAARAKKLTVEKTRQDFRAGRVDGSTLLRIVIKQSKVGSERQRLVKDARKLVRA